MRASEETLRMIRDYYALMDAGRLDECEQLFTPNATLKIAHHPEISGRETIARVMKGGLEHPRVKSLSHEVKEAWEEEGGLVIFEVHAAYELKDGSSVVVPGVVISETSNGRFRSQRIAADLSPVFGSSP